MSCLPTQESRDTALGPAKARAFDHCHCNFCSKHCHFHSLDVGIGRPLESYIGVKATLSKLQNVSFRPNACHRLVGGRFVSSEFCLLGFTLVFSEPGVSVLTTPVALTLTRNDEGATWRRETLLKYTVVVRELHRVSLDLIQLCMGAGQAGCVIGRSQLTSSGEAIDLDLCSAAAITCRKNARSLR